MTFGGFSREYKKTNEIREGGLISSNQHRICGTVEFNGMKKDDVSRLQWHIFCSYLSTDIITGLMRESKQATV